MNSIKNSEKQKELIILPIKIDKFSLFYGILLGDGCLSRSKRSYLISVVGHINDDLRFFFDVVRPTLNDLINKNPRIKKRPKQGVLQILISHKELFNILKKNEFPVGKKGTTLNIPLHLDMRRIIQGYFATDGCLVLTKNPSKLYPRIEFSSISNIILEQTLEYLTKLGMNGNIYISHKYSNPKHNTLYRLQFNGRDNLEIFRKNVGFVNPKHTEKYHYFIKKRYGEGETFNVKSTSTFLNSRLLRSPAQR
jgi:hypothetical protein